MAQSAEREAKNEKRSAEKAERTWGIFLVVNGVGSLLLVAILIYVAFTSGNDEPFDLESWATFGLMIAFGILFTIWGSRTLHRFMGEGKARP